MCVVHQHQQTGHIYTCSVHAPFVLFFWDRIPLCSPVWFWAYRDLPSSSSQMLGLKVGATMPGTTCSFLVVETQSFDSKLPQTASPRQLWQVLFPLSQACCHPTWNCMVFPFGKDSPFCCQGLGTALWACACALSAAFPFSQLQCILEEALPTSFTVLTNSSFPAWGWSWESEQSLQWPHLWKQLSRMSQVFASALMLTDDVPSLLWRWWNQWQSPEDTCHTHRRAEPFFC